MIKTFRMMIALLFTLSIVTSAFAQDSIGIGDSVDGEADGDVVEYEIELEEDDEIVITLESDDFDTLVRILDEDEDELDFNDDGEGMGLNSMLEFTADDDATYIIVVDAFGGDPEGDFELSVEGAEEEEADDEDEDEDEDNGSSGDGDLVYDEEFEFDVDGEDELEVTFEGSEDDVVTIVVRSEADQSVTIELQDPEGDDIALFDEFSFGSAALLRIELPEDGLYTIVVEERNGEELEDEIEIEVLETELLDLGDGAQSTELDSNVGRDVMFFEAEEDVVYSIVVAVDGDTSTTLDIDVCEGDPSECFFPDVSFSMAGADEAAFLFEASDDGIVTLKLDTFIFGGDELEVTIEVGEQ